jgi:hypothetical protein
MLTSCGTQGTKLTPSELELTSQERTSLVGGNLGIEEGVDVDTNNVHNGTENIAMCLENVERLGGGHLSCVSSALESTLHPSDESSQFLGRTESIEHRLVTNNEQDHE